MRKIAEETDFTFVNKMLEASYCKNFGRPAKEPEYKNKIIRLHQEEECTLKSIQEEYGVSKTS